MGHANRCLYICVILITADIITSLVQNKTNHIENNSLKVTKARRNAGHKKSRSTSSESGDHRSTEGSAMSLGISSVSSSSTSSISHRAFINKPKSTEERKGWRKWHRKCTACPGDMVKKWRDRTINWICGGYQRARRSFKSECMMHYRNCQDGTMFVKIHDLRCENDTGTDLRHGLHFFYEYGRDSQDSKISSGSESSSVHVSSDSFE